MGISSFICTTYPHTFPTIIVLHRYPMVTHPNVGAGGSQPSRHPDRWAVMLIFSSSLRYVTGRLLNRRVKHLPGFPWQPNGDGPSANSLIETSVCMCGRPTETILKVKSSGRQLCTRIGVDGRPRQSRGRQIRDQYEGLKITHSLPGPSRGRQVREEDQFEKKRQWLPSPLGAWMS